MRLGCQIAPLIYAWAAQNTAGTEKLHVTNAAIFVCQSLGNISGPFLFRPSDAPSGYKGGLLVNALYYACIIATAAAGVAYLRYLNRKHSRQRIAMGLPGIVIDVSADEAAVASAKMEEARRLYGGREAVGKAATGGDDFEQGGSDLKNPMFLFRY